MSKPNNHTNTNYTMSLIITPGLTPEEKIRLALDWVARLEPIAIPTVLTRWRVVARPQVLTPGDRAACPTMSTDGRTLNYNPAFVDKISFSATKAIVLHETGHVLSQHQHRRGNRNPKGYNIAADLALNDMLYRGYVKAYDGDVNALHVELIDGSVAGGCFAGFGTFANLPRNQDAETYYDLLKQLNPPPPKGNKPQPGDPSDSDDGEGTPSDGEGEEGDDEGQPGKGKGKGSGSGEGDGDGSDNLDDLLDELTKDKSDDPEAEEGSDKGAGSGEGEGEGEGISPSDFEDDNADGGGKGDSAPGGKGKDDEHDPFANLPDPSETFGGGIEDAPVESELRDDEGKIVLESLLGSDSFSPLGLGNIISQYRDRLLGDPEEAARINWQRELEKFLRTQHAAGWKFDRPSRRHGHRSDILLPARRARSKTKGLLIADTSGSMSDADCQKAITHMGKILALFPSSTVTMIHCDTSVRASKEYRSCDFPIREFEGWKGRGGTDMNPAFKWAKANKARYDWVVIVTDMEFHYWDAPDPGLPTLWLNTKFNGQVWCGKTVPFGKLLNLHPARQ
jgi:predicted metal-dependent peptidase